MVWREIPEYPGYLVSNDGRVLSRKRRKERELSQCLRQRYRCVKIGGTVEDVQTLMLLAWVGPRPPGNQARHLDGDKENNAVGNLAWGTVLENRDDKVRHGRTKIGAVQAREIRNACKAGEKTQKEIAAMYGITQSYVSKIVHERRWADA